MIAASTVCLFLVILARALSRISKNATQNLGSAILMQLLEKLRLSAFAETCRFQTIQSLEFQEIWQKIK